MKMSSASFCPEPASMGNLFPVSTFSAFHLLRNYNYLLAPQSTTDFTKHVHPTRFITDCTLQTPPTEDIPSLTCLDGEKFIGLTQTNIAARPLLRYTPTLSLQQDTTPRPSVVAPCGSILNNSFRRQRGEKKPIPDEQKDEKYFERRRRNNQAAKKSRDARKIREDQIALRATLLEHENAILKAQVLTLREEASSLRQMLLQKKTLELNPRDPLV